MSRLYLSKPCAFLPTFSTRCCGRSQRPVFPAPSVRERADEMHNSGENRAVRIHAVVPGKRSATRDP